MGKQNRKKKRKFRGTERHYSAYLLGKKKKRGLGGERTGKEGCGGKIR